MTKWLIYLGVLFSLIVITIFSIAASKAGFLIVENCEYEYLPCSIEEKFTLTFHGHKEPLKPFPVTEEKIPEGLIWQDGGDQKPFADPNAKQGGTLNSFISTFPQTLRQKGLNANTQFRSVLDANDMNLIDIHPSTDAFTPALATEWAIGPDQRTVYYRLNPAARWSDGVPVTADDYICTVSLCRAPGIIDPWSNNYFTEHIESLLKFDDHTIAIRLPKRKPDIVLSSIIGPVPYHFYGNFLRKEHTFRGKTAFYTLKNNNQPIPDELKYFQIKEQLDSLEIFLVGIESLLNTSLPQPEPNPAPLSVDSEHLLSEVVNTLAEAIQLSDLLDDPNGGVDPSQAIRQLKTIHLRYDDYKTQLATLTLTPEQAKKEYMVTVDDVAPKWNKTFNWRAKPNTGPYQISKFIHGKWILLKRSNHWWANDHKFYSQRYNPDFIRFRLISKLEIAYEYFKQAKIDSFGLTLAEYWYKKAADLPQYKKGYLQKIWLWNDIPRPSRLLSMNLETEILKDKNVRLGIAHALNIQKMIDLAMLGDACQANSISTGYRDYSNLSLKAYPFDIEKSIEYLERSGWTQVGSDGIRIKDGQRLTIKLLYFYPEEKEMIMVLKEEAAKAGIELKPDTYDTNTVFKFVQDKKHELVWHGWSPRHYLVGPTYYGSYHSDGAGIPNNNNFCNFADPEVDHLIEIYRNSNRIEKRKLLAQKIQLRIHEACCAIPTYYTPFNRSISWRWLQIPSRAEFQSSETLFDYGLFWIDEEMKKETLRAMKTGETFPKSLRIYDKYRPKSAE